MPLSSQRPSHKLPVLAACCLAGVWLADAWAFSAPLGRAASFSTPATVGLLLSLVLVAWSAHSARTIRRLAMSNDFGRLFNPHDSLEASLCAFAGMLRSCQRAESCLVVIDDAHSAPARIFVADGSNPVAAPGPRLDARLTAALLAFPPERAVLYERPALPFGKPRYRSFDVTSLEDGPADVAQLSAVDNLLEARSFIGLPLRSRGRTLGRVFLVSQRRAYRRREAAALVQLMAQAGPLIENMQLVEQLAFTVAEQERRRISRDLHDSTVQPYIGLKLGLEALRRGLPSDAYVARELDELIGMAGEGISQLRQYVGRLKGEKRPAKPEALVQSVRAQVHRLAELYSIEASIHAPAEILVSSALCEEITHIVHEALSNIRRHTQSRRASVELCSSDGILSLAIVNERGGAWLPAPRFHPRSIGERVRALGGQVRVGQRNDTETLVAVEIPL